MNGFLAYCALAYFLAFCIVTLTWQESTNRARLGGIGLLLIAPIMFTFCLLAWSLSLLYENWPGKTPPTEGGCWFCHRLNPEDELYYTQEFDAYAHIDCVKAALTSNPKDREALLIAKEWEIDEDPDHLRHRREE